MLSISAVWNTTSSHRISIGTVSSPVTKLLNVHGKLWCSIQGVIKVLDIETLSVSCRKRYKWLHAFFWQYFCRLSIKYKFPPTRSPSPIWRCHIIMYGYPYKIQHISNVFIPIGRQFIRFWDFVWFIITNFFAQSSINNRS